LEAIKKIEAADEFATEFDVGDLVFTYRDKQAPACLRIHDDVGGLQGGVAEEAVGVEVFVFDLVELLFVGGMRSSQPSGVIMLRRRWSSACSGLGIGEDCGFVGIETGG